MKQIDFLPQRYRDQDAQRQAVIWRLLLLCLFGGVVVAAAVAQLAYRASVRATLDQVRPQFAEAQAKSELLAQRQSELNDAAAAATLCALLESPWPRTQILAAILEPLSAAIAIEEIHLAQQEVPAGSGPALGESDGPAAGQAGEIGQTGQPAIAPARQDLLALHAELAARQTIGHLTGTTSDAAHLNAYLELLQASPLVVRVELLSLEHDATNPELALMRFTAQVTIRQSLAQQSGPPPRREIATSQPQSDPRTQRLPLDRG